MIGVLESSRIANAAFVSVKGGFGESEFCVQLSSGRYGAVGTGRGTAGVASSVKCEEITVGVMIR